jgi:phage N-6-adenine-methyltransferase
MNEATRKVLHSSASVEWETPQDLFDRLNAIYGFTLDVCATPENAKCARYFTREEDGLEQRWTGRVWCNPPYGKEIAQWVRKAFWSTQVRPGFEMGDDAPADAESVVMLLPARTDTRWWHDYVIPQMPRGGVNFIRGRLKFGGHKNSAPFPSAIVVFGQIGNLDGVRP